MLQTDIRLKNASPVLAPLRCPTSFRPLPFGLKCTSRGVCHQCSCHWLAYLGMVYNAASSEKVFPSGTCAAFGLQLRGRTESLNQPWPADGCSGAPLGRFPAQQAPRL